MLLATTPAAGALLPKLPAAQAPQLTPPLPVDIKDADVLALLAPQLGITPTRLPLPTTLPPGQDIATLATTIGARAGLALTDDDRAAYRALDPRLTTPIALMLLAMNEAWTLRDQAFDDWTPDDITAAIAALETGTAPPKALPPEDLELLINAAILLSDTIESILIPQLQAAADLGIWPATPVADPVGVLRIGGTGNDIETLDRILQIDARGDDTYKNNAGGAYVLEDRVVAASIDLAGSDQYECLTPTPGLGAGQLGIGVLYDLSGIDVYREREYSGGSGTIGIGLFRDIAGNDVHLGGFSGIGYASTGVGYFRDDAGDDTYRAVVDAGGVGSNDGLGLYWDRNGTDLYHSALGAVALWGVADGRSKGWFVDETDSVDSWTTTGNPQPHACNDCIWTAGDGPTPGGRGNDNRGGLGYLIAYQQP